MFAQKFSINASATYTFVNNSIEQYTFIDPENPGVFQTTYGNIGKKQSYRLIRIRKLESGSFVPYLYEWWNGLYGFEERKE